ncbi:hypothetical protein [Ruegeria meonggei]|uniref:Uncharacterized protein n=1 Tax=Ruegeria meonggei TaxID=1446476 RepID=A0A1X6ZY51_9RHOB|nr:hypothetical protein [Ruegeria meonggei]SLN64368.1 hypothetical protein RUM8411_03213 [Ruegeria meonggei]
MLAIQAIPLSLSILWRYVMVFPVLVIGLFLYGFLGGLLGFVIGLIIPAASVILMIAISASSGIIPVMVGTRFGFASQQIMPSAGYKKLILPSIVYGATEALAVAVLLVPTTGLLAITVMPDVTDLTGEGVADLLNGSFGASLSGLSIVAVVAICAIRASILVPIASASLGRDPDDRAYTPFRHFGESFWYLFALVLLSYVGIAVIYTVISLALAFSSFGTVIADGLIELAEMIEGTAPWRAIWPVIAVIALYIVIGFWALSVQCAGGVLVYLRLRDTAPAHPAAVQPDPRNTSKATSQSGPLMNAEDLRALRKSREQGNH